MRWTSFAALLFAGSASAADVTIDFDDLGPGVTVTNQYPEVTFSTIANYQNVTTAQSLGTSAPNFLCTATSSGGLTCAQPTVLDFTENIEALRFRGVGINDTGPVAQVRAFLGGVQTATVDVIGQGDQNTPVLVDLTALGQVGRIEIVNITDGGGIGWDDFSFDVCGAAVSYGDGCAGSGGFVPALTVDCAISAGNPTSIAVDDGLGGTTAVIVFGLGQASLPIGAGCSLLVTPVLPATLTLPLGGAGAGNGSVLIAGVVPAGTSGVQFTAQAFVADPATQLGFSVSAGRAVTIG